MEKKQNMIWIYMTAGNQEEAKKLARLLVEENLVACVNIFNPMTSIYFWEGKIQEEQETVLVAKTREELFSRIQERVEKEHSYACPCILALPVLKGNEKYLNWISQQTS